MKTKLSYLCNAIISDRWSEAIVIIILSSLLFLSISERLYSGENSLAAIILMGAAGVFLLLRWIYIAARLLKFHDMRDEDAAKALNINARRASAVPLLTYAALWFLIGYTNRGDRVIFWLSIGLTVILATAAIAASLRSTK